ncbi:hypothetical protein ACIP5Y_21725 [Nocardia sp. NPDC088792]|uniref:hypothetical protein n=1 Tax=Nocardia sp. NPDC088792 TaxID=3364332 RepID=UPI00382212D3
MNDSRRTDVARILVWVTLPMVAVAALTVAHHPRSTVIVVAPGMVLLVSVAAYAVRRRMRAIWRPLEASLDQAGS